MRSTMDVLPPVIDRVQALEHAGTTIEDVGRELMTEVLTLAHEPREARDRLQRIAALALLGLRRFPEDR